MGRKSAKTSSNNNKCEERQKKRESRKGKQKNNYKLTTEERKKLIASINALGLTVKVMTGDGNCMFRSLADQLEDKPTSHGTYRQRIVEHIEINRATFEPFIEDEESFDDYCQRMRRGGEWGGHHELFAASRLFNVNIIVHQYPGPNLEIHTESPRQATKTIHLSYHGELHYNSVRPINEKSNQRTSVQVTEYQLSQNIPKNEYFIDTSKLDEPNEEIRQKLDYIYSRVNWSTPVNAKFALKENNNNQSSAVKWLERMKTAEAVEKYMNSHESKESEDNSNDKVTEVESESEKEDEDEDEEKQEEKPEKRREKKEKKQTKSLKQKKEKKIKANDVCPCGSGKLYRKCCRDKKSTTAESKTCSNLNEETDLAKSLASIVI